MAKLPYETFAETLTTYFGIVGGIVMQKKQYKALRKTGKALRQAANEMEEINPVWGCIADALNNAFPKKATCKHAPLVARLMVKVSVPVLHNSTTERDRAYNQVKALFDESRIEAQINKSIKVGTERQ